MAEEHTSEIATKLRHQNSSSGETPSLEEDAPLALCAGADEGSAGDATAKFTTSVLRAAPPQGLRADGRNGIPGKAQHQGRQMTTSSTCR